MIILDKYSSAILIADMKIKPLRHWNNASPFKINEKKEYDESGKYLRSFCTLESNPEYIPISDEEYRRHSIFRNIFIYEYLKKNYRKQEYAATYLESSKYKDILKSKIKIF